MVAWTIRVGDHQSWANDVERGVNVHGVGVLERDNVDVIGFSQVALQPFDSKVVGDLRVAYCVCVCVCVC